MSFEDRPQPPVVGAARARLPLKVANPTPVQPVYRRTVRIVGGLVRALVDCDWDDASNLPAAGPVIVVSNHISDFDPVALAQYLIWNGRWPRALGKSDLWRIPGIGQLARATGQIPVERNTDRAKDALVHAEAALRAGECVVIYPEGTKTADPQTWPMTSRPGAARLALSTGAPVVPVAQWGANYVMAGKKLTWPRFWPRKTMIMRAGTPVELHDLGGADDPESVRRASLRIMAALTGLLAEIRGEEPPELVFDIRVGHRVPREQEG
ncbi:MAG TPA: lysophospholipid acyltransferase family protein [Propionicimonas sp.]|nr:lysophospholipid acyltransferase family protein [Propionicimonas sp.]